MEPLSTKLASMILEAPSEDSNSNLLKLILIFATIIGYALQLSAITKRASSHGTSLAFQTSIAGLATNEAICFTLIFDLTQHRGGTIGLVISPPRFGDCLNLVQFIVQWLGASFIAVVMAEYDTRDSKLAKLIVRGNLGAINLAFLVSIAASNTVIEDHWFRGFVIYFFILIIHPFLILVEIVSISRQTYITLTARQAPENFFAVVGHVILGICYSMVAFGWISCLRPVWSRFIVSFFKVIVFQGEVSEVDDVVEWMGEMGFAVTANFLIAFGYMIVTLSSFTIVLRAQNSSSTAIEEADEISPLLRPASGGEATEDDT